MLEMPANVETLSTSFPTTFTWRYDTKNANLKRLYSNAKRDQWDGTTALDWTCSVDPEAENLPDSQIAIYGSQMWDRLTTAERARRTTSAMSAPTGRRTPTLSLRVS